MALDTSKQPPITGNDPLSQSLRQIGQTLPSLSEQLTRLQRMLLASGVVVAELIDPDTGAVADKTGNDAAYTAIAAKLGAGWTAGQVKLAIGIYTQAGGFFAQANHAYLGAIQQ